MRTEDDEPEVVSDHVLLLIQHHDGRPRQEPVHAEPLGAGIYRLLFSPGFVQGIAAGDEFRVLDEDGAFEVVRRSGNLAVQVYSDESVESFKQQLEEKVRALGGVLDGSIDRGMVFTIPLSAGFVAIEALFNEFVASSAGVSWFYGNVYDAEDKPLGWWNSKEFAKPRHTIQVLQALTLRDGGSTCVTLEDDGVTVYVTVDFRVRFFRWLPRSRRVYTSSEAFGKDRSLFPGGKLERRYVSAIARAAFDQLGQLAQAFLDGHAPNPGKAHWFHVLNFLKILRGRWVFAVVPRAAKKAWRELE